MAPSSPLLLVKDNNRSKPLIAHSLTLKFGEFYDLRLLDTFLTTISACIVKWVTKNNRPASIVNDTELRELLTAGRPHATIPSVSTVTRDITASFAKCCEKIGKMLKVSAKSPLYRSQLTSYDRTIPDAFTLQLMLGRLPTIGPSSHGQYIFSTKVRCSRSSWTSSRCPK